MFTDPDFPLSAIQTFNDYEKVWIGILLDNLTRKGARGFSCHN